jgi:dihydroneopterin aldolase
MATLRLVGLAFNGLHGHLPEEKITGNRFEIDISVDFDLPESDDLADVPDYSVIAKTVEEVVHGPSVHLIETLVRRIGDTILDRIIPVRKLTVTLRKLQPPMKPTCLYSEITHTWQNS